jgi:hypothetical protein
MWKLVVDLKYSSQWGEWCSNGVRVVLCGDIEIY